MDQYIGKFLDNRYELLEVIGTGGMAVVYKARCHRLNRLVAVKILKTDLAQDEEFRRRFHDESQAVAMLSHPNIVAVYDVSKSAEMEYIVMELIDGLTLKQYMQKKGTPLNWREALHYITQIMRALSHAHSRGIIHRDIKPHNIMVLRDGSVKVADFGIARLTSAAQATLTQEALGSVHYISPEQARGSHIDARSDIYSAGVVLYEMITGRLPFEGESPVSVAIQHINSIPLSPRELNPDIPEALEEITMKAMAPNPDERYLSADDMLADLEEFRKNPNINFDYTPEDLKPCDEPTRPVPVGPIHAQEVKEAQMAKEEPRPRRRRDDPRPQQRRKAPERSERDYDDYDDRRGPVWPILLAVGVIVVLIGMVAWFLWTNFFDGILNPIVESREVPDLRGKTLSEIYADHSVTDYFTVQEGELVSSEEYPAGQVVSQDPEPRTTLKGENLVITVDISSGSLELTIPKVENMEQRRAIQLLEEGMGLVVSPVMEPSDEITKGYAIRTDLPVGTPVRKGDMVTLVVSSGPKIEEAIVTPFVGQPLSAVMESIDKLGLILGDVTPEVSSDYPEGYVTWQSIPAGTPVATKTMISLRVSGSSVISPSPSSDVSPSSSGELSSATPSESGSPSPSPSGEEPPVTEPPVSQPPAVTDPPVTSPDPTPSTPPTPSVPVSASKNILVELPESAMDKSAVTVRIEVDNEVKKNQIIETTLFPITPLITGQGTQEVRIYIDDVLVSQYMETFS